MFIFCIFLLINKLYNLSAKFGIILLLGTPSLGGFMFETLMSKTFIILTASLTVAWLACMFAARLFNRAVQMQDYQVVKRYTTFALIANIGAFLLLLFMRTAFPFNMLLMALFTASSGFSLGVYFL